MSQGRYALALLTAAALLSAPAASHAEWRCDCTKITGSCTASVVVEDNWVKVTSDERACSRVDYYIDGQPFVTVAIDGEAQQSWLSPSAKPAILVGSCQTCEDKLLTGALQRPAAASAADEAQNAASAPLAPLVTVAPALPPGASAGGYVVLSVDIAPDGTVRSARVTDARPRQVLDRAAIDAVRRYRYAPLPPGSTAMRQTSERVEFRASAAQTPASAAANSAVVSDGRIAQRNGCVKRAARHDLVDIQQAELINACSEPLVLYTCAQGLGAQHGEWLCDMPQQRVALVQRGDVRDGQHESISNGGVTLRYMYAETHYLSYPASSRYWWIACEVGDLDCHRAAQRWQSLLNGRPASVHPKDSSDVAVATSD